MIGGTPPVSDRAYVLAHPSWRNAYHRLRQNILNQYRADREACKKIPLDGRLTDSAGLTLWDLERAADQRAREALESSIRRRKDVIEVGRGL